MRRAEACFLGSASSCLRACSGGHGCGGSDNSWARGNENRADRSAGAGGGLSRMAPRSDIRDLCLCRIYPAWCRRRYPSDRLRLGFLVLSAVADRRFTWLALRALRWPKAGFWLALVVAYAVVSAVLFPRL